MQNKSSETKKLWTVVLRGGKIFEVYIPYSDRVYHNGIHSLHHIFCDRETLKYVLSLGGADLKSEVISGEPNEEQQKERALFSREDWDKSFPCIECPKCFWFDLKTKNHCGLLDWEEETQKASIQFHKKSLMDMNRCPLNHTLKKKV